MVIVGVTMRAVRLFSRSTWLAQRPGRHDSRPHRRLCARQGSIVLVSGRLLKGVAAPPRPMHRVIP